MTDMCAVGTNRDSFRANLSKLLTMWGDAPCHDMPPSTCPLNLINP